VPAWLEDERASQVVGVPACPFSLFEHRGATRRGKAFDHESKRTALCVRVDCLHRHHAVELYQKELTPMPLVDPGKKAPAFSLKDQDGKTRRLADYAGRPVVLYFYPKDDTPGCTKEACAFRDNLPRFKPSKAVVLGVSILDEASKARFAEKYDLPFPLLADPDHSVAEKFGVWQKRSLYGRTYMGIARTTYLIGPDGKVAKRWDNVKVDGHAEAVLEALNATA
jgi:thioredoxin-dependent peroxiredoxin